MAALLAAGLIPLVSFAVVAVRLQRQGLQEAEKSLEISIIGQVGASVDRPLDNARAATRRVGQLLIATDLPDEPKVALLSEAVGSAEVLSSVMIFDAKGEFVDAILRRGEELPARREPITFDPGEFVGGAWLAPDIHEGRVSLRFLEAILRDGKVLAWVRGEVDGATLSKRVAGVSLDHLGRADRVLLLDETLRVIAAQGGAFAVGTPLEGRDILRGTEVTTGALQRRFGATREYTDDTGERMVGSFESLPAYGWLVVVRRPEDEAYAALVTTRHAFLIAGALFAILTTLVGVSAGIRATRPIAALVTLSREFARRKFAARSTVRTGDELEALGDALQDMADDLERGEVELTRRATIESNLSRFLPATVAKAIADGERTLALGGERREITVLFADVAGFTTFAESAPPEQVVAFLNELFGVMTEVVFRHEGTVDKFIGDSMMALYGAPKDQPDHAARALTSAEDLHRFVEASTPAWQERFGFTVRLAIGIATGEALVGNLGSEQRMEYTAIGDVVNVASRLESLAAPGQTLATAEVASRAGDAFSFLAHASHPLRGRRQPVEVVEPIS